jgi:hypothetical protein
VVPSFCARAGLLPPPPTTRSGGHHQHRQVRRGRAAGWDEQTGTYLDPATGEVLPTWHQALDAIGHDDEPWHVALFDAQGILSGSKDANRCIGYLTKYLTKEWPTARVSGSTHAVAKCRRRLSQETGWVGAVRLSAGHARPMRRRGGTAARGV